VHVPFSNNIAWLNIMFELNRNKQDKIIAMKSMSVIGMIIDYCALFLNRKDARIFGIFFLQSVFKRQNEKRMDNESNNIK